MKSMMIALLTAILFIAGCGGSGKQRVEEWRKENVVRVLMTRPGSYALLVATPGSTEIKLESYGQCWVKRGEISQTKLFADVAPSASLWAKVVRYPYLNCVTLSEIHIRGGQDVEGGAWQERIPRVSPRGITVQDHKTVVIQ